MAIAGLQEECQAMWERSEVLSQVDRLDAVGQAFQDALGGQSYPLPFLWEPMSQHPEKPGATVAHQQGLLAQDPGGPGPSVPPSIDKPILMLHDTRGSCR